MKGCQDIFHSPKVSSINTKANSKLAKSSYINAKANSKPAKGSFISAKANSKPAKGSFISAKANSKPIKARSINTKVKFKLTKGSSINTEAKSHSQPSLRAKAWQSPSYEEMITNKVIHPIKAGDYFSRSSFVMTNVSINRYCKRKPSLQAKSIPAKGSSINAMVKFKSARGSFINTGDCYNFK